MSGGGARRGADPVLAGALAAAALHDLSNVLAVARTSAQLAAGALDDRVFVARHLDKIARKLDEAEALARRSLAVARGERVVPTRATLAQVLAHGALELALPEGVALVVEPAVQAHTLLCEPALLGQALANLIDNALRAMQRSGVGSRVQLELGEEPGRDTLWICDDGPGLPPALAFANVSEDPRGSGLGMLVARAIAEAHGGTLRLAERPPFRTALALELPAATR